MPASAPRRLRHHLFASLLALAALYPVTTMSSTQSRTAATIPLAVLGDSDSHSYQDQISFVPGSPARGGSHRTSTFQWTETMARLRGDELDLGAWGIWGDRAKYAKLRELVGLPSRVPRKQDYRYNFAVFGAECEDLMQGPWRQAPRLLDVMDEDPAYWRRGVVVIRIGTNSFGKATSLERMAERPDSAEVQATIEGCLRLIGDAVTLIHARHPQTRFVLVGIFDNVNWARYLDKWRSPRKLANIAAGLDRFDDGLRALARSDRRLAFFDERAWFGKRWGSRGSNGEPAYRAIDFGQGWSVANTAGDDPRNAVLADGHAGVVWNALWVQDLVHSINDAFALGIKPVGQEELVNYLNPLFR